ncbi:MAG: hypothetical protein SGPRY_015006 [Prymnesium sp.]
MALNVSDYSGASLPADSEQSLRCVAAHERLRTRTSSSPPLLIDPLSPLPLVHGGSPPAVHFVFYILASRSYAYETINRNVRALQNPHALTGPPSNQSNLFLLHLDAKMNSQAVDRLRAGLHTRADVYEMKGRRAVMWSGFSMVLALLDAMASLLARPLHFEMFINLSDADLTLRTDGELRSFFSRFPGRSVMSIVQRSRDPRRYHMHETFRKRCWIECDGGRAFMVWSPTGERTDALSLIGKKKCCWSRSAPIYYTHSLHQCANGELPEVFHGSQWGSLHHSLVRHIVMHPVSQAIVRALENTLLPDEAMLQAHSIHPPHAGPSQPTHHPHTRTPPRRPSPSASARTAHIDPSIYPDVLPVWDRWMAFKLLTQSNAQGQPGIAQNLLKSTGAISSSLPSATPHERDTLVTSPDFNASVQEIGALGQDAKRDEQTGFLPTSLTPFAGMLLAVTAFLLMRASLRTCEAGTMMLPRFTRGVNREHSL